MIKKFIVVLICINCLEKNLKQEMKSEHSKEIE